LPDIAVWGYGLAAVAYLFFALYLFSGWRGGRPGAFLLAAVLASALWAGTGAVAVRVPGVATQWLSLLLEVVHNAAWLSFLVVLLRPLMGAVRWPVVLVAVAVLAQLSGLLLPAFDFGAGLNSVSLILAGFLVATVAGLVLVEQLYRWLPAESRWGLKPLCLALAAAYVLDLYFYADAFLFGRLDGDVWAARGFVHIMLIPLIALSAARSPSWTMRISVSRELAFHSTALALSGLYLLVIAAAGYYVRFFGGDWGRTVQLGLLFGGVLLLGVFVFSGAQRARLRVLINKHLFPYRYDYRNEWLRFTQALSRSDDSLDLGQSVIQALADLVESSGGLLWLKGGDGVYRPHARLNQPPCDVIVLADSEFSSFIDEHEWIVNLEEWRQGAAVNESVSIPAWLSGIPDAWLVLPLKSPDGMIGFVVLSTARTRFEINWEVRDLLKTALRQAASYLARMQAAEALLEARKFDSFNRMSAFVVHDLKNLVSQMSLMLKNAERHRDNPEFQQDMIDMVAHVEGRMRSLMAQLLEKSPVESRRDVVVADVLNKVCDARRYQGPQVGLDVQSGSKCVVQAHPERLERILGHIVQNALDATDGVGNVQVRLTDHSSGMAEIVVEDDGCGMSEEFVREHLFRPFRSSKESGMGIGAYEANQYIREIGGEMQVDSAPERGTRISIQLPCAEPRVQSAPDGGAVEMEKV